MSRLDGRRWHSSSASLVGALAVLVAVRPALLERRRRVQEVIELERALAGVEAELAVERGSRDERLEAAIKALSTEALDANSTRFLELAETHLSGHVRPLKDSLERMDKQLQSVERVRQESYGALQTQVTRSPSVTGEPHERPPHTARPRALGRGAAAERRRVRGNGRVLRLRRAGRRHRRTTARCARTSSFASRAESTSSIDAKAPLVGVPRRIRDLGRRRAATTASPITHARCATTSGSSLPRATGDSSTRRPTSSSCSSRRVVPACRARARPVPAGVRVGLERDPRVAEHAHRAASHGRA